MSDSSAKTVLSFWRNSRPRKRQGLEEEEGMDSYALLPQDDRQSLPALTGKNGSAAEPIQGPVRARCLLIGFGDGPLRFLPWIGVALFLLLGGYGTIAGRRTVVPSSEASLPTFGTGMTCDGAVHYYIDPRLTYTSYNSTVLNIQLEDNYQDSFVLSVTGSIARGTVIVRPEAHYGTDVTVEFTIHSRDPVYDFGAFPGGATGGFSLQVYDEANDPANCVQYELVLSLPTALRDFKVDMGSRSHMKFEAPRAAQQTGDPIKLRSVDVALRDSNPSNLLLLDKSFAVERANFSLAAGAMRGSLLLERTLSIDARPDAEATLAVEVGSNEEYGPAVLDTYAGAFPFHMSLSNHGHHRRVSATHHSFGDLDLQDSVSPRRAKVGGSEG